MRKNGFAVAALGMAALCGTLFAAIPENYSNTIKSSLLEPLLNEIAKQKLVITRADQISQTYKVYRQQMYWADEDKGHHGSLVANTDRLQKKLTEFEILVYSDYHDLGDFSRVGIPLGSKFFVVGTTVKNSLSRGRASIENQQNFMIDLHLPQYVPDQQALDYAFVAYGTKVDAAVLQSDQLLFLPILQNDFESTVATYHGNLQDVAAHYYYGTIIPGNKFNEMFLKIKEGIDADVAFLFELQGFKQFYMDKFPRECTKCGRVTDTRDLNGECPVCAPGANFFECKQCHSSAGYSGFLNAQGLCASCAGPEPSKIPWGIIGLVAAVILVIGAIVTAIVLFANSKPKCKSCGAVLVNGKCVNPSCPSSQRHCTVCGSLVGSDGNCLNPSCPTNQSHCTVCGSQVDSKGNCLNPSCPTNVKKPCCPACGSELGPDGECPNCTRVVRPGRLVNVDTDATCVPSRLGLKVIGPDNWAKLDYTFTGLPRRFEIGRDSGKTQASTPFLLLNMKDHPRAQECSRRYVRLTESDSGDGFTIDLLTESGNACVIDGKAMRNKGECGTAKVGSIIELNPDWKFEVVKASEAN